ncbi:hypothetical protein T492DRAFT_882714 [Pavlovales sp. CCMP2436]|nr:hypothetical protein T492DRAFT_882714 [Pavlovales sp. CCMP2436]
MDLVDEHEEEEMLGAINGGRGESGHGEGAAAASAAVTSSSGGAQAEFTRPCDSVDSTSTEYKRCLQYIDEQEHPTAFAQSLIKMLQNTNNKQLCIVLAIAFDGEELPDPNVRTRPTDADNCAMDTATWMRADIIPQVLALVKLAGYNTAPSAAVLAPATSAYGYVMQHVSSDGPVTTVQLLYNALRSNFGLLVLKWIVSGNNQPNFGAFCDDKSTIYIFYLCKSPGGMGANGAPKVVPDWLTRTMTTGWGVSGGGGADGGGADDGVGDDGDTGGGDGGGASQAAAPGAWPSHMSTPGAPSPSMPITGSRAPSPTMSGPGATHSVTASRAAMGFGKKKKKAVPAEPASSGDAALLAYVSSLPPAPTQASITSAAVLEAAAAEHAQTQYVLNYMAIQEKARAAAGEAGMEPMAAFALQRMTAITADIATQAVAARAVIVAAAAAAAASEVEAAAKAAAAKAAAADARSAERTVRGVAQAGRARVSEFDLTEDGEADRIYGNEAKARLSQLLRQRRPAAAEGCVLPPPRAPYPTGSV